MKKSFILLVFFFLNSYLICAQIYDPYELSIANRAYWHSYIYRNCYIVYYKERPSFKISEDYRMTMSNLIIQAKEKNSYLHKKGTWTITRSIKSQDFSFGNGPNGEELESPAIKKARIKAEKAKKKLELRKKQDKANRLAKEEFQKEWVKEAFPFYHQEISFEKFWFNKKLKLKKGREEVLSRVLDKKAKHYFESLKGKAVCSGQRVLINFTYVDEYLEERSRSKKHNWDMERLAQMEDAASVIPVAHVAQNQKIQEK